MDIFTGAPVHFMSLLAISSTAACGVAEGPIYWNQAEPSNVVAQSKIGVMGGLVQSEDGSVVVDVPAGALGRQVDFTIAQVEAPPPGAVGIVYELDPTETELRVPARVSLSFDANLLTTQSTPALARLVDGVWKPLELGSLEAGRVDGSANVLGTYAVIALPTPEATCRGDKKDAKDCCPSACSRCLADCCEAAGDATPGALTLDVASPAVCQCSRSAWLSCAERCVVDGEGVEAHECRPGTEGGGED